MKLVENYKREGIIKKDETKLLVKQRDPYVRERERESESVSA